MTLSPDAFVGWNPPAADAAAPEAPEPRAAGALALPDLTLDSIAAARRQRGAEEEIYQRGVAAGLEQGRGREREALRPLIDALARLEDSIEATAREVARGRERDLQGLAIAVARKLVQRELETDPNVVRGLVARALELLPPEAPLEVRVHAFDLSAIREEMARLRPDGRNAVIHWVADPSMARGDFIIESPMRIVDGRTDVALRSLYERLGND